MALACASAAAAAPPTVTSVSPKLGKDTGGTSVTISGSALTGATAVEFGTIRASSFTVNSDTQISAVAPPAPVGTVNVTITNPEGKSAVVPTDRFTFLPPGGAFGLLKGLTGSEGGSEGASGGGAGSNGAPGGAPGAVGSGTASTSTGSAVVSGSTVTIAIACSAKASCSGLVTLSASGISHAKRKPPRVLVASGRYSIPAGKTAKVRLHLTRGGRSLLKARHGRLRTTLKLTPTHGRSSVRAFTLKSAKHG